MRQILIVFYKVLQEIRLSFKSSRSLITIKQRAGNRYLHAFVVSFMLSILGVHIFLRQQNYLVFKKQKQIENQYLNFRERIESQIVKKNTDSVL